MRNVFRKIHLWLSIPLGIIIVIMCLSGAILVFQNELRAIFGENNTEIVHNASSGNVESTGGSLNYNRHHGNNDFFSKVGKFHKTLFMGRVGKIIVVYTTFFFVFILISGIYIWWPKTKNQLKYRLTVSKKHGKRQFWWSTHVSIGIYVVIGLLILSFTGLSFSDQWFSRVIYGLFGAQPFSYIAQNNLLVDDASIERTAKIVGLMHQIHMGTWAGLFSKTLTFLVAIFGASLPITGYYLYFTRHRKKTC